MLMNWAPLARGLVALGGVVGAGLAGVGIGPGADQESVA